MRRSQAALTPRSRCPIALALDVLGDPWTLLIVRDLLFKGARLFGDFAESGERIATNVLSDRLARLEANGIVDKTRDTTDARRFVYRLTEKGMGLAPVLTELVIWSAAHGDTDAPPDVVRAMRADRDGFVAQLHEAWKASLSDGPPSTSASGHEVTTPPSKRRR